MPYLETRGYYADVLIELPDTMRLLSFTRRLSDVRMLLVIGVLAFSLAACEAEREDLVGEWQAEDGTSTLVFGTDGSVAFTHVGQTLTGTYALIDDEAVRLDLPGMEPIEFEYEGDDDFEMDIPGIGEVEYEKTE